MTYFNSDFRNQQLNFHYFLFIKVFQYYKCFTFEKLSKVVI